MKRDYKKEYKELLSLIQDIGKAAAKKLGCSHYWQILGSETDLINANPRAALANGVLTLTKTGD